MPRKCGNKGIMPDCLCLEFAWVPESAGGIHAGNPRARLVLLLAAGEGESQQPADTTRA